MPEHYDLTLLDPDGKLGRDIRIMRTEIEELHAKLARMPAVIARTALGIMHHGYKGSPALVFDFMEPRRPQVDGAVLAFALSETFTGADFIIPSIKARPSRR